MSSEGKIGERTKRGKRGERQGKRSGVNDKGRIDRKEKGKLKRSQ
jgi:hypothetical protein